MCATLCHSTSKTLVLLHIIAGKTFQRRFRGSWNGYTIDVISVTRSTRRVLAIFEKKSKTMPYTNYRSRALASVIKDLAAAGIATVNHNIIDDTLFQ